MIVWFGPPLAALPTTTSIRPKCAATCSASALLCSRSPMSVGTARPRAPSATNSVTTEPRYSLRRAATATS